MIVRDVFNLLVVQLGFGKTYIWNIASDIFNHGPEVYSPMGHVVGFLADFVIGGMIGVAIGLVIHWTGTRFCLLKGLGVGLAIWVFFFGVLQHNLPGTTPTAPKDALSNFSASIGHGILGIVTAWTILKLTENTGIEKEENRRPEIVLTRWFQPGKKRRRRPGLAFKPLKPKD